MTRSTSGKFWAFWCMICLCCSIGSEIIASARFRKDKKTNFYFWLTNPLFLVDEIDEREILSILMYHMSMLGHLSISDPCVTPHLWQFSSPKNFGYVFCDNPVMCHSSYPKNVGQVFCDATFLAIRPLSDNNCSTTRPANHFESVPN